MKKIISLFQRNHDGDRLVRDEITPGAQWVVDGEGIATQKFDGTCCLIRWGVLYKRYDAKPGREWPEDFVPAQGDPDPVTGHWPGWLPVSETDPADRYHREAWKNRLEEDAPETPMNGTYELCGPKIQGNPEGEPWHMLIPHGSVVLKNAPRDFEGLREYLSRMPIEGIVWHHPDGVRMVKIKARDFGLKRAARPQREEAA